MTREEIDAVVMRHQEGIGQQPEDSVEFVEILQKHGVKSMLQIGVATGQDAAIFLQCLPEMRWLGIDTDPACGVGLGKWIDEEPDRGKRVSLVFESSRSADAMGGFLGWLHPDKELDCLFIDGDHSFDGVVNDYAFYSQLVKKGGLIAFHDINVLALPQWDGVGPQPVGLCHVPLFWDGLKRARGSEHEIGRGPNGAHLVSRTGRRREGIGVIVK